MKALKIANLINIIASEDFLDRNNKNKDNFSVAL
jgi:hypothetical protein